LLKKRRPELGVRGWEKNKSKKRGAKGGELGEWGDKIKKLKSQAQSRGKRFFTGRSKASQFMPVSLFLTVQWPYI